VAYTNRSNSKKTMHSLTRYGFSSRLVAPQGSGANGVLILGEAPGQQEDTAGIPFAPWADSGSVLERAIKRSRMDREQFVITNTVPYRPPNNWLEGAPWEHEAIAMCEPVLAETIDKFRPRCILTLGGIATRAVTGLAGRQLGVSNLTGYLLPSRYNIPTIPCFHPSYLRRGKMSLLGVLMRALKMAVMVAKGNLKVVEPPIDDPPPGWLLYPNEAQATAFVEEALNAEALAYDIETPWSEDEDSAEEAEGEQRVKSIQFATRRGRGIYLEWRDPYVALAKRLLSSNVPKLGWNNWRFDDPVLRANGADIRGPSHDLMWAWHHLQPDLPRGLQFAAGQSGWPWPWKHLSGAHAPFYGVVDVDVLHFLWA
jgi:uracil-DNA glycosylase family 4